MVVGLVIALFQKIMVIQIEVIPIISIDAPALNDDHNFG
jgi:hypothetical protein